VKMPEKQPENPAVRALLDQLSSNEPEALAIVVEQLDGLTAVVDRIASNTRGDGVSGAFRAQALRDLAARLRGEAYIVQLMINNSKERP